MPASPPRETAHFSFADVYDVLYDNDPAFRAAQLAYLTHVFGAPPARLLDAGCGTGCHLVALRAAGYDAIGLDADLRMMLIARHKSETAHRPPGLIWGDLRALPFADAFDGILCLESPLAYLRTDDDLSTALAGLHRSLRRGGLLVIDVFDYLGTFGEAGLGPQTSRFPAAWGSVSVEESHRYEQNTGVWIMRQAFKISRERNVERFTVEHRLRMRSAANYRAALEKAGFTVVEYRTAYPDAPAWLEDEYRMIVVAQARR